MQVISVAFRTYVRVLENGNWAAAAGMSGRECTGTSFRFLLDNYCARYIEKMMKVVMRCNWLERIFKSRCLDHGIKSGIQKKVYPNTKNSCKKKLNVWEVFRFSKSSIRSKVMMGFFREGSPTVLKFKIHL
jgi:hypothetical protein